MNTDEALRQYNALARKIFSQENQKYFFQDGKYKASTLERVMKAAIKDSTEGATGEETMLDLSGEVRAKA